MHTYVFFYQWHKIIIRNTKHKSGIFPKENKINRCNFYIRQSKNHSELKTQHSGCFKFFYKGKHYQKFQARFPTN